MISGMNEFDVLENLLKKREKEIEHTADIVVWNRNLEDNMKSKKADINLMLKNAFYTTGTILFALLTGIILQVLFG